jgi:ubiquinone biosynthesis protein COQ9
MDALQQEILDAALPDIAFDGWSMAVLRQAAQQIGKAPQDADRAFPGGEMQAIRLWSEALNAQLKQALEQDYNLSSMKIRERIATGVMVRLRLQQEHREAARKAMALCQLPWNLPQGLKQVYEVTDVIWRAAGDTSTDWNFYSKRGLLAKVYSSTVLVWLNDDTPDQCETEAFLYRRIEDVMKIQKVKGSFARWKEKLTPTG